MDFFFKRIALKVDVLKEREIYCLQAWPGILQVGAVKGLIGSTTVWHGCVKGHTNATSFSPPKPGPICMKSKQKLKADSS